jgi:ABC-2 type transport system ATP-binding protein
MIIQEELSISTEKLTRRFNDLVAVNALTFSVARGRIFGLLGPNGAGKSTLIKMLTTLLPPSSGTALVAGFDIVLQSRDVRRQIGYVSQMLSADGELTGYENLLISAKLYGLSRSSRAERIGIVEQFAHVGFGHCGCLFQKNSRFEAIPDASRFDEFGRHPAGFLLP